MAPLALPEMTVGENVFTYSDQSTNGRKVRITHEWVERSSSQPPAAPPAPLYPPDGGEADGTDIVFKWNPPGNSDGDFISDYHFELSARLDMRWPLSMSFYKLISRTLDSARQTDKDGKEITVGKPQYTLALPGSLTPDRRYYWHVRAMNDKGVWGPWSGTWSFVPRAPDYPLNVTVDCNDAGGSAVLRWSANLVGRRPVKYRVYGSDEKGFTVADVPYQGTVGITTNEMAAWNPWFPANFIAETSDTELAVMGCNVTVPAANKTYYRVVAVDAQGKCSGPSDFATAPQPVIYSSPQVSARVGAPYRYTLSVSRSLGDLSSRMNGNDQVNGYFDIEKPKFALARGPAWLKMDENTGVLSGTPEAAADADVEVNAVIDLARRNLDEKALVWGNEKILSTNVEQIGMATQKFTIQVR